MVLSVHEILWNCSDILMDKFPAMLHFVMYVMGLYKDIHLSYNLLIVYTVST